METIKELKKRAVRELMEFCAKASVSKLECMAKEIHESGLTKTTLGTLAVAFIQGCSFGKFFAGDRGGNDDGSEGE